ncbi:MAG: 50S ribosomal protein L17 [Planctomycetota bacterium]|nr:50S ribosomal protein L17 [Planctomycetota bacterium]
MRHRLKGRKLGRTTAHRKAMSRNLVTSLFVYGRVTTTVEKAKELRGMAEKLITLGKKAADSEGVTRLAFFRRILQSISDKDVARKIINDIAPRFADRKGGYTRVIKLGGCRWDGQGRGTWAHNRLGDNGSKAIFELVVKQEREEEMKLAGRGRAAQEALAQKRAEKKAGKTAEK